MAKEIFPQLGAVSFSCPHCYAIAHQTWQTFLARQENILPYVIDEEEAQKSISKITDPQEKSFMSQWLHRKLSRRIFLLEPEQIYGMLPPIGNLATSQCYSCKEFGLWLYDKLIWPENSNGFRPNEDMPIDVARDFVEAASILEASPRGAAALLRLAVQKLCKELGEKGKNIDEDIASLVKKGLDIRIQQALDIIRVVGNEAVHPGTIDFRDDIKIAAELFELINLIVDAQISQPKHVSEVFSRLPQTKLDAIQRRDRPAAIEPPKHPPLPKP